MGSPDAGAPLPNSAETGDEPRDEVWAAQQTLRWWDAPIPEDLFGGEANGTIGGSFVAATPLSGRRGVHRNLLPSSETQRSAAIALDRLDAALPPDGGWSEDREAHVELAALTVLAHTSIGETHQSGTRRASTKDAARFLCAWSRGASATRATPRTRALAALALAELYGLTFSILVKSEAEALATAVREDVRQTVRVDTPDGLETATWQMLALYVAEIVELDGDPGVRTRCSRLVLSADLPAGPDPAVEALRAIARTLALALEPVAEDAAVAEAYRPVAAIAPLVASPVRAPSSLAFLGSLAAAQTSDAVLRGWLHHVLRPMAADTESLRTRTPSDAAWEALCLTSFFHMPRTPRAK